VEFLVLELTADEEEFGDKQIENNGKNQAGNDGTGD
jgi:hypothetical protein